MRLNIQSPITVYSTERPITSSELGDTGMKVGQRGKGDDKEYLFVKFIGTGSFVEGTLVFIDPMYNARISSTSVPSTGSVLVGACLYDEFDNGDTSGARYGWVAVVGDVSVVAMGTIPLTAFVDFIAGGRVSGVTSSGAKTIEGVVVRTNSTSGRVGIHINNHSLRAGQ